MIGRCATGLCCLLAVSSCTAPGGDLSVRPVLDEGTPAASAGQPVLAIARQHFRQGNFALAAHEFRRALRYDPDLVDAYNGLAASYDQMGRFDLAQRYYQEALARAPEDPAVRHNYALSLSLQDRRHELRLLALENAALGLETPALSAADIATIAPISRPEPQQPRPTDAQARLQRLSLGEVALITSADSPLAIDRASETAAVETVPADRVAAREDGKEWSWQISDRTGGDAGQSGRTAWLAIFRSVAERISTNRDRATGRQAGRIPHSRIRMTASGPEWSWRLDKPVTSAVTQPVAILNAVGRRGQAARMRRHLQSAGWDEIRIGDAARRQSRSAIQYAHGQRVAAQRLAEQLPFDVALVETRAPRLVLVLGRDAIAFDRRLQRQVRT